MKTINNYIIEKLHLNKYTKVSDIDNKYIPNEKTFDKVHNICFFTPKSCSLSAIKQAVKTLSNPISLIKLWLAIQIESNSTITQINNEVFSYPGNFGKQLIDKAFETDKTLSYDDIEEAYKLCIDKKLNDKYFNKNLLKYIKDCVEGLLENCIKGLSSHYNLKEFTQENYSKFIKDNYKSFYKENNPTIIIPFEITYDTSNIINCEIVVSYEYTHYYGYFIEGKAYSSANAFAEELNRRLNLW